MATTYKTELPLFLKKVQSETAKHLNHNAERAEPLKNGRKYFLRKATRVEGTKNLLILSAQRKLTLNYY